MLKRLNIYFRETFPLLPRLVYAFIVFAGTYLMTVLANGVTDFSVGAMEICGGFTVFCTLLGLRVVDEFKDYETDKRLFPNRPLPSGRVYKKDLRVVLVINCVAAVAINVVFCRDVIAFFAVLFGYGVLMSLWFFAKKYIQKSLVLALVTHNPIVFIMNCYVIAVACRRCSLPFFSLTNLLVCLMIYLPGLCWEVSRKIRAPGDETEYETYSKIFGFKKPVVFLLVVMLVQAVISGVLLWRLLPYAVPVLAAAFIWLAVCFVRFLGNPKLFNAGKRFEAYVYIISAIMLVTQVCVLLLGK